VFHIYHYTLGFLIGEEFIAYWSSHNNVQNKSCTWRLSVDVFKLFIKKTQIISYYQFYAVQNVYNEFVLFSMMREGLCFVVTELHGFCGRWY
jgi:hypothetical protein